MQTINFNIDTVTDRKSFREAIDNFKGFHESIKKNWSEERRDAGGQRVLQYWRQKKSNH